MFVYINHMNVYATSGAVQAAIDNAELVKPYVAYVEDEDKVDWNSKDIDYLKMPLTFDIISGGTLYFALSLSKEDQIRTIEYSKNGGEWTSISSSSDGSGTVICDVVSGDKVRFRGDNSSIGGNQYYYNYFKSSDNCYFNAKGNIMSLLSKDGFPTKKTFDNGTISNFRSLFRGCSGIIDASKLQLPATALTNYCYAAMFTNCANLTIAPELTIDALGKSSCPDLFSGCRKLSYFKCLAVSKNTATNNWMYLAGYDVENKTFVKHPDATWGRDASGIPADWTVIDADI